MHGFALTQSDGSKLHGMCLTVWIPLGACAAFDLNRRCEDWRAKHVSDAERELAVSLAERLSTERAKLSLLLADLSSIPSDTPQREAREEEILKVEEKIAVWSELLQHVKFGPTPKLEGLPDGETGFWVPRAFGVLGRDASLTAFWKEWLRAVAIPMMSGAVLGVPASSPKIGVWQPLERYVINLCAEALCPISSITQVELAVRELRLYARKTAVNEIPGSRNTHLYPLFRCLDIPEIITLFEYVLSESRVIFVSSHPAMLHLACTAIIQLLYPLTWSGIYIPVLPTRLIQAIEAPCPYIIGIRRQTEPIVLPDGDDCVMVDLDQGFMDGTVPPPPLPRQQRRKLAALLGVAAPHRYRYGVSLGPPIYATEVYPFGAFPSENAAIYTADAAPSRLSHFASLSSTAFGPSTVQGCLSPPLFNAFRQIRPVISARLDRTATGSSRSSFSTSSPTSRSSNMSSLRSASPNPIEALPRTDSRNVLRASLRDKRSGGFDNPVRNSSVCHSFAPSEGQTWYNS